MITPEQRASRERFALAQRRYLRALRAYMRADHASKEEGGGDRLAQARIVVELDLWNKELELWNASGRH